MSGRDEGNRREFVIKLRALPRVDAIKGLRRGLKYLLRRCGLRATEVSEIANHQHEEK